MRRASTALCAVALLLTVLAPGAAAGGPPQPVTITSTMWSVPNDANQGTFAVTGTDAICADGLAFDIGYVFGATRPGHLREIMVTKAFVCNEDDAFLVRMQVHEDLAAGTERFTWVIFKGFGAFKGLAGHGSGSTTSDDLANGPWLNTCEGFVID
jgi:hypothetical protein